MTPGLNFGACECCLWVNVDKRRVMSDLKALELLLRLGVVGQVAPPWWLWLRSSSVRRSQPKPPLAAPGSGLCLVISAARQKSGSCGVCGVSGFRSLCFTLGFLTLSSWRNIEVKAGVPSNSLSPKCPGVGLF